MSYRSGFGVTFNRCQSPEDACIRRSPPEYASRMFGKLRYPDTPPSSHPRSRLTRCGASRCRSYLSSPFVVTARSETSIGIHGTGRTTCFNLRFAGERRCFSPFSPWKRRWLNNPRFPARLPAGHSPSGSRHSTAAIGIAFLPSSSGTACRAHRWTP
jgi:hypothetical protein